MSAAVASAIRSSVARRPLDMVARYGGEEIVAILPGADRGHAADVAAAILKAVADLQIAHGASTTRPYVTVSVGVTTVDPAVHSHEHAVRLADLALYSIKARGRDGWSFYEPAEQAVDHQPGAAEDRQLCALRACAARRCVIPRRRHGLVR